uniref:Uncharacterized protein n=1 Tax=Cucumis melo TaxID=3656 RepID=A0A9I9EFK4_CUCME
MSDYYTSSLLPSRRGRNHKELQLAGFRGVWRSGIQDKILTIVTELALTLSSSICLKTSIASKKNPFWPNAPIMVFQETTFFSPISPNKSFTPSKSAHLPYIDTRVFFTWESKSRPALTPNPWMDFPWTNNSWVPQEGIKLTNVL